MSSRVPPHHAGRSVRPPRRDAQDCGLRRGVVRHGDGCFARAPEGGPGGGAAAARRSACGRHQHNAHQHTLPAGELEDERAPDTHCLAAPPFLAPACCPDLCPLDKPLLP
eukprot:89995-Chlamydomonas_euryale.AAC.1